MGKVAKRICSIVVVFCIVLTMFPLSAQAATSEEKETEIIIKQYDEFINKGYYFNLLTTDGSLYYKRWVNNLEEQNVFGKGLQWITSIGLDMNLSVADYTVYLSKLIAMLEKSYMESESAQKEFDDCMDQYGSLGDSIKTSASALELTMDIVGGELFDSAKATIKNLGLPIDVAALGESVISDLNQFRVLTLTNIAQSHKRKILESIRDSTDIKKLKTAASDMLEVMNLEYIYILNNYAWDTFKMAWDLADAADMAVKIKSVVEKNFPDWYNTLADSGLSKAAKELLKKVGTFLSYAGAVFQGLSIGADIMKSIVGDDAELMKEALAMDDISDALSKALKDIHNSTSRGTEVERVKEINDFILIGTAQTLTHFRGEYCHLQSTATLTINTAFQKSDYLKKFSDICNETQDLLNGILEVDPSSYLEVAWIKGYSQYGDSEIHFKYNDNGDIELVTYYSVSESGEQTKTSECAYYYDSEGRLICIQPENYPFPKAEYHYNDKGQLISYSEGEGSIVNYTLEYDAEGQLTKKTGIDITTNITTYVYNHLGQVVREKEVVNMPDGSPPVRWSTDYEYDDLGRILRSTFSDGYRTTIAEYCYDYLPLEVIKQDRYLNVRLIDSMGGTIWTGSFENAKIFTNGDGIMTEVSTPGGTSTYEICEIGYNVEVSRTGTVENEVNQRIEITDYYDMNTYQFADYFGMQISEGSGGCNGFGEAEYLYRRGQWANFYSISLHASTDLKDNPGGFQTSVVSDQYSIYGIHVGMAFNKCVNVLEQQGFVLDEEKTWNVEQSYYYYLRNGVGDQIQIVRVG